MLNDASLIAFAATSNADRAIAFYRDTLGLRMVADEPFALVFDVGGTQLRIQKVDAVQPPRYTTLGWEVRDIRATVAAATRMRVLFERYDGMRQDGAGIWTSPSGSLVAWFKDPDGNLLSLTQPGSL